MHGGLRRMLRQSQAMFALLFGFGVSKSVFDGSARREEHRKDSRGEDAR